MLRHRNLVDELSAEPSDGLDGCKVVRITCDGHITIDLAHKRRDGAASLVCVAVAAKFLVNFESDVPRTDTDVFGVSDSKIDVAGIGIREVQDSEVIRGYETFGRVAGNDVNETQSYVAERQIGRGRER